jgi:hypothetical protein
MRRFLLISLGFFLTGFGTAICLIPLPLPPVGITSLIGGLTLLVANSRKARRGIQRARHHSALLSRTLEHCAARAPQGIRRTLSRTRPDAIARQMQISALSAAE